MEVAVVDCYHSEELLSKTFSSPQTVIFCLQRGMRQPQQPTTALSINNLQWGISPGKYHLIVQSEVELGFRLCQFIFMNQNVTVYTTETMLYSPLGVQIVREAGSTKSREEVRPWNFTPKPDRLNLEEEAKKAVLIAIKKDAMQKYLSQLGAFLQRPTKTERAKNVLKGFLTGIYTSKKYNTEDLDNPSQLTDDLFKRLQEEGVVTMSVSGSIQYNDAEIHRLQTDPSFLDLILTDRRAIAPPQPVLYAQPDSMPYYFETSTCQMDEETLVTTALLVCEDLNKCGQTPVTVGVLLDSVYWRVAGAGMGQNPLLVRRLLEMTLSFQAFYIPRNTNIEDFLVNTERYRNYPLG